jgi:hypothetical protein
MEEFEAFLNSQTPTIHMGVIQTLETNVGLLGDELKPKQLHTSLIEKHKMVHFGCVYKTKI